MYRLRSANLLFQNASKTIQTIVNGKSVFPFNCNQVFTFRRKTCWFRQGSLVNFYYTTFGARFQQGISVCKENVRSYSSFHVGSVGFMAFLGLFKTEEEEDELIMTIKRSVLLIQKGELKKAEKMLHLALRIAQQTQNVDGITYVYDLLANVALENGELEKSEKLFVTVMQRLLSNGVPQDDNKILHMSLKLAEIYMSQFLQTEKTEFETKAKDGFKFCSEALRKKIDGGAKDEDTILLMSLAAEGNSKLLANQGLHAEARKLMQNALDLSRQSEADSEERQASLLSDLGALCTMCGDDASALKYLHEAVDIGRKSNIEYLPAFLVNLGLLSLSKGLKPEALSACQEAWNLSRSQKNKQYENEATFCINEIKK